MIDLKRFNLPFEVVQEQNIRDQGYDGLLFVSVNGQALNDTEIWNTITPYLDLDPSLRSQVTVFPIPTVPAGRIVHAGTGNLDPDVDDVRSVRETAVSGTQRALRAGIRRLLVVVQDAPELPNCELVTLLGVLQGLYIPLQILQINPGRFPQLERLGVHSPNNSAGIGAILERALILDSGLRVDKDITNADSERMTPAIIQAYVEDVFANSAVTVDVIDDDEVFARDYPLFEAVNRATKFTENQHGRIIYLEYNPPNPSLVTDTLFFVGKGVTFDTGGADVKTGGNMAGMSTDKAGAAAVAGILQIVNLLRPPNIRVVGGMAVVRNSIGSNCYVQDELIQSKAGVNVLVTNTDAEGRFAMADVLNRLKERALVSVNPKLFVIGTLTGHAWNTAGTGYSTVLDNGPARADGVSKRLQEKGDSIADPIEVSILRREDFSNYRSPGFGVDLRQTGNIGRRGHQGVAGFMLVASGLDKHGSGSERPLKYTHIDIASHFAWPLLSEGAPILAIANAFILDS